MKYRKKEVVVEAVQWLGFEEGPHDLGVVMPPGEAEEAWIAVIGGLPVGWIETPEGGRIVRGGDYIITESGGGRYPCRPDIFEATYEIEGGQDDEV